MANWNGLDFFIFLILVLNTILGMARGATKEIISMMCLSIALIFSIRFTVPLANFFNSSPQITDVIDSPFVQNFMTAIGSGPLTTGLLNQVMYSISLLICFVGVFSLCEAALTVTGFTEFFSFPYAALNRKVGGTLGFTRGYIISLIFISIMLHIYKAGDIPGQDFISGSFFARLFKPQAQRLDNLISSQQPEKYYQLYQDQPYSAEDVYRELRKPETPTLPQQQQTQPPSQPQPMQQQIQY